MLKLARNSSHCAPGRKLLSNSSESPQFTDPKTSRVASSIELPSGQRVQFCPAAFELNETNKRRVEMSLEVEVNAIVELMMEPDRRSKCGRLSINRQKIGRPTKIPKIQDCCSLQAAH